MVRLLRTTQSSYYIELKPRTTEQVPRDRRLRRRCLRLRTRPSTERLRTVRLPMSRGELVEKSCGREESFSGREINCFGGQYISPQCSRTKWKARELCLQRSRGLLRRHSSLEHEYSKQIIRDLTLAGCDLVVRIRKWSSELKV